MARTLKQIVFFFLIVVLGLIVLAILVPALYVLAMIVLAIIVGMVIATSLVLWLKFRKIARFMKGIPEDFLRNLKPPGSQGARPRQKVQAKVRDETPPAGNDTPQTPTS